jgi:hypothetical protein
MYLPLGPSRALEPSPPNTPVSPRASHSLFVLTHQTAQAHASSHATPRSFCRSGVGKYHVTGRDKTRSGRGSFFCMKRGGGGYWQLGEVHVVWYIVGTPTQRSPMDVRTIGQLARNIILSGSHMTQI